MPTESLAGPLLDAVLDTIIPAGNAMPGAGQAGLAGQVLADAADGPLGAGLRRLLAALPGGFAGLDQAAREQALRDVGDEAALAAAVNLIYTAYYTDPHVLALIEAATGYRAGPPQPGGYHLEPFDPQRPARVRLMTPSWRKV